MLFLARKVGQAIHIGDDIVISVEEIRDDQVIVGVKAPNHIAIDEAEALYERPPLPEVEHIP